MPLRTSAWFSPSAWAIGTVHDYPWTDPNFARIADAQYATASLQGLLTDELQLTGFGANVLPASARLVELDARWLARGSDASPANIYMNIISGGATGEANSAVVGTIDDVTDAYYVATGLIALLNWTLATMAKVRDSGNFGLVVYVGDVGSGGNTYDVSVDSVQLRARYSVSDGGDRRAGILAGNDRPMRPMRA